MKFSGVVFDLDGTLLDTESLSFASARAAFARQDFELSTDHYARLVGVDMISGQQIVSDLAPEVDLDQLNRDWVAASRAQIAQGVALRPGALDLLNAIRGQLPFAIATSAGRKSAAYKITNSPLAGLIDTVITRDDVTAPKPAPEPYLLACQALGVAPQSTLAFEDSETGAASAKAAGLFVVQVPDLVPSSGEFADVIADTLHDGAREAGLL